MSTKTNLIAKTVSASLVAATFSLAASPAFSKQCMHRMGYMYHHMPHSKHYGHGPKWSYGYMNGYGSMHRHSGATQQGGYDISSRGKPTTAPSKGLDLVDTAIAAGNLNTLVQALDEAGLRDLLKGTGPFTVFAPTDEAFAKLPEGQLDELLANKEKLATILKYHVVPRNVNAVDVLQTRELKTAGGKTLPVESLAVAKADIETSNGTIHIVDSVLIPTM